MQPSSSSPYRHSDTAFSVSCSSTLTASVRRPALWNAEKRYICLLLQPWESAAVFGNAVVNAVLCWFYDGKKNAVVKVFTYAVFLFRFYSVVDNS